MLDTPAVPRSAPPVELVGQPRRRGPLALAVGLAVLLGVLVRLGTRSQLWLDEALSVNIAQVPLSELPATLRRDGAPPLYYVLLHGWTAVVGTSNGAVRALSQLCALAALPLAWLAGRRLGGRAAGWTALLLLASNPFAVRYATETRMYALVVLLVLAGVLALEAALRDPRPVRLLAVALLSAALALTHYWALFLLLVVGAGLVSASVRGPRRASARRCVLALGASGLLFLPWLPTFLYQSAHTGTPWAQPPGMQMVLGTWHGWGGSGGPASVLGLVLLVLALAAPVARRWRGPDGADGVVLRLPLQTPGTVLTATALGTLAVGVGVTALQSTGYALRYSSVALAPALLAAAIGAQALPTRARALVVALAVALGLASALPQPLSERRTQAGLTAAAMEPLLSAGDVVVYCPDQLGPAVDRLLPVDTQQVVYPSGAGPRVLDWVDYAQRNAAGDPRAFAAATARRARGAVWLVTAAGYRTYGQQCTALDTALTAERGSRSVVLRPQARYGERAWLLRYP